MTVKTWAAWTREEIRRAEAWRASGLLLKQIAHRLGRTPDAVRVQLSRQRRKA